MVSVTSVTLANVRLLFSFLSSTRRTLQRIASSRGTAHRTEVFSPWEGYSELDDDEQRSLHPAWFAGSVRSAGNQSAPSPGVSARCVAHFHHRGRDRGD